MAGDEFNVTQHECNVLRVEVKSQENTHVPAIELHDWVVPDEDGGGVDVMLLTANGDCQLICLTEKLTEALLSVLMLRRMLMQKKKAEEKEEGTATPQDCGDPSCPACFPPQDVDFPYGFNVALLREQPNNLPPPGVPQNQPDWGGGKYE